MKLSARILVKFWFLQSLALLLNIITWVIVAFKIRPGSEPIPLHYNIFYGADTVGSGHLLYEIPAIGLFIFIANFILASIIKPKDRFASMLLVASTILAEALIFIAILFLKSFIVL